jgi:hypothetical protein
MNFKNELIDIQKNIKPKVNQLEEQLKYQQEERIKKEFQKKNKTQINQNELENILNQQGYQKIYFNKFTVNKLIDCFNYAEKYTNKILIDVEKIIKNEIIDINKLNFNYKQLKNFLDKLDLINKDESYWNDDLKHYINQFKKNLNSFKNDNHIFSKKVQELPKINIDKII